MNKSTVLFITLLLAGCSAPPAPDGPTPAPAPPPAPAPAPLPDNGFRVGIAESDLTPKMPYGLSGYYHERKSTEIRDPLHAKALVFRQGSVQVALVMCDLCGVSPELTAEVRKRAAPVTGILAENIIIAATHTHTGPAYEVDLRRWVEKKGADDDGYPPQLIAAVTDAVVRAAADCAPLRLRVGSSAQETPISFCRRFLMKDGKVKTWATYKDPETVREANPIDPEVAVLLISDAERARAAFVNFALHLDTLGGTKWSADFPHDMGLVLRSKLGDGVLPIFGNGCCGDINHNNPRGEKRNSTELIGTSLGETALMALPRARDVKPRLGVQRSVVRVELQNPSEEDLQWAHAFVAKEKSGVKFDFLEQVKAHKILQLERMRRRSPALDLEVHAIRLGADAAIVTLPGEVFVELGLAIKKASPFKTTFIVELANTAETSYIPKKDAYPLGGYEVINSTLAPGGGEQLVAAAIRLLEELR